MGAGVSMPFQDQKVVKGERYKIYVYSGPHLESGADAEVSFCIIGSSGKSTSKKVTATLSSARSKSTMKKQEDGSHMESFNFRCEDDLEELGAVEVVNNGEGPQTDWEIHKVVVEKVMEGGVKSDSYWQRWVFPCYGWVAGGRSRVFFHGSSYLPHHTPVWMHSVRDAELKRQKEKFNWGQLPGMPGLVAARQLEELPRDERVPLSHVSDPKIATANVIVSFGLSGVLGEQSSWDDLSENNISKGTLHGTVYENPADAAEKAKRGGRADPSSHKTQGLPIPEASIAGISYWEDDVAFGRAVLQGSNPVMFKSLFEFPEELINLTDEMLEGVLRPRRTIDSEFEEGRMFLLDYRGLWPHKPAEFTGKYSCAPICLLYSTEIERSGGVVTPALIPIAIKLHPEIWDSPIWTPMDEEWEWNMAKAWVMCCDSQFHMVINSYLHTQAVVEPLALAAQRRLSTMHPVFKLTRPYFKYMLANGIVSRRSLMGHGGIVESLFTIGEDVAAFTTQEYNDWRIEDMGLPASLVKRGLDGTEKLPDYPYRDDGMLVWGALVDFVSSYLRTYYKGNVDVAADNELQLWYKEVKQLGHPEIPLGEGLLEDLDVLEMLLATTIWICSAHRSAMTYNRYESYGFPPNRPVAMRRPPPAEKGSGLVEFLDSIPNRGDTATLAAFMHHTSTRPEHLGEALGEAKEEWISDLPAVECLKKFQESLEKIEQVISMRNERRLVPYEIMLPSKIRCCPV